MRTNNSLYVHIPFCEAICDYCDFAKLQYFRIFAEKYIDVLSEEIKDIVKNKDLKTIYVGGGTPTVLEDDLFLRLLETLKPYAEKVEEYTFEANPESLSLAKLEMMKKYGVNRISLGVESTDNRVLKAINRHHTWEEVIKAVENIKKVGINNFNLDLILGLPNVTKSMLKRDVDNLLSLSPKHISTYSLTVHEHTKFYLQGVEELPSDESRGLYDLVRQTLLEKGYVHYEVSNFALPGYESKHNFVYWNNDKYYGVGLAAAGYVDKTRYKNTDNLDKYLKGDYGREIEALSKQDEREYAIMLNLRTNRGIDLLAFEKEYGVELLKVKAKDVEEMVDLGLLIIRDNHLIATYEGMMILDQIILRLI